MQAGLCNPQASGLSDNRQCGGIEVDKELRIYRALHVPYFPSQQEQDESMPVDRSKKVSECYIHYR